MRLTHTYPGRSQARGGLHLAPDLGRDPTYLRGRLARPLAVRDALTALHGVVVSDLHPQRRERAAYRRWLETQDQAFLESRGIAAEAVRIALEGLRQEAEQLARRERALSGPYRAAQQRYFRYLLVRDFQAWVVLDPVITVHPDELFFEAFSRDESTYARVGVRYGAFAGIESFRCGTTNIDFSLGLRQELRRMRTYRATRFDLDPGGFGVVTASGEAASAHHEKKIDLPASWVRGFLEVQSAMALGPLAVDLAAIDIYELIRALKARKARQGPRALVWVLEPGERVRVIVQPWDLELRLSPGAVYRGPEPLRVRTWGRDRLRLLEPLLPYCRSARVHLLGDGMPSFYTLETGDLSFTLGLSSWTKRDWASGGGYARAQAGVDPAARASRAQVEQAFGALEALRVARTGELLQRTGLEREVLLAGLRTACGAGRATYDLAGGVFRHRELFAQPLPWETEPTPREVEAKRLMAAKSCQLRSVRARPGGARLRGAAGSFSVELELGPAREIVSVTCTCKETSPADPCAHTLAVWFTYLEQQDS